MLIYDDDLVNNSHKYIIQINLMRLFLFNLAITLRNPSKVYVSIY